MKTIAMAILTIIMVIFFIALLPIVLLCRLGSWVCLQIQYRNECPIAEMTCSLEIDGRHIRTDHYRSPTFSEWKASKKFS